MTRDDLRYMYWENDGLNPRFECEDNCDIIDYIEWLEDELLDIHNNQEDDCK